MGSDESAHGHEGQEDAQCSGYLGRRTDLRDGGIGQGEDECAEAVSGRDHEDGGQGWGGQQGPGLESGIAESELDVRGQPGEDDRHQCVEAGHQDGAADEGAGEGILRQGTGGSPDLSSDLELFDLAGT